LSISFKDTDFSVNSSFAIARHHTFQYLYNMKIASLGMKKQPRQNCKPIFVPLLISIIDASLDMTAVEVEMIIEENTK